MSDREQFINSILLNGKGDFMQVKFISDTILKDVADEYLNDFAVFCFSQKSKYDNSIQAILNAVKLFNKQNYIKVIRERKPFEKPSELLNFVVEYFSDGDIVGSGIPPFSRANIVLKNRRLVNERTGKVLMPEDECDFLHNLLDRQELIGISQSDKIAKITQDDLLLS